MKHLVRLLSLSLCLLVVAAAVPSSSASVPSPKPLTQPPNIVLVLADDLDLLLDTIDTMPNLQALLTDQGMTFSNFFVPDPLCCPARASLLTGRYLHNHRVYTNLPPSGGFQTAFELGLDQATFATALRDAGYRTALIGKYLNGYPNADDLTYIPPGWDEWFSPTTSTAYGSYNYQVNDNGVLVNYGDAPQDYITDILAQRAVRFITETVTTLPPAPFFELVSVYAPHSPSVPAPRHAGLFPDAQVPRTPNFNEADMSDKPPHMQNYPSLTITDTLALDTDYRLRLRSMQAVDELLVRLVNTLAETGQLDNTYIIFTSDNGLHLGQHRMLEGKGSPYEEDIRVPFIVRGPGVPAGPTRNEPAGLIDLAPTFAEIAGTALAVPSDGSSLLALWHDTAPHPAWRTTLLVEHYYPPAQGEPPLVGSWEPPDRGGEAGPTSDQAALDYSVLRTAGYKYIERGTYFREIYAIDIDPYELDSRHATVDTVFMQRLSAWLANFRQCAGASCRVEEARVPPFTCDLVTEVPRAECDALLALYNGTQGRQWVNRDGWLSNHTPCAWYGVTCQSGHVTRLRLAGNRLRGLLSAQLGGLASLEELDLGSHGGPDGNQLAGPIPPELGALAQLRILDLDGNALSGDLPSELGNLASLQSLNVAANQIAGPLPPQLAGLNLTSLHFEQTALCEPPDAGFQAWLAGIGNLGRTGVVCRLALSQVELAQLVAGQELTVRMTANNADSAPAASVTLSTTLPANVVFVNATPAAHQQGNTLIWSIGNVPAGGALTVDYTLRLPGTPGRLSWPARATGSIGGPVATQIDYTTDVIPWADFSGDRQVDASDIQMIGWCWRRNVGGTCLPGYHVDDDNDIDIVDIQRVAGAAWTP